MFGMMDGVLILIVIAIILLFGAPKVIEWAKSLGEAKKAFEEASSSKPKTKDKANAKKK